jgi:hypothetical protein
LKEWFLLFLHRLAILGPREGKAAGSRQQAARRRGEAEKRRDGDWRTEVGSQRSDYRLFKLLNIEQQNKKPQNDELITSIFEIPCSIFCGSKSRQLR